LKTSRKNYPITRIDERRQESSALPAAIFRHLVGKTEIVSRSISFITSHDLSEIEGMIILLGIKGCITTGIEMGRVHG